MAPEPNPIDNLNTIESNSAIIRMPDSDSEDENVAETSGYMPLSQIPIEGEPLNDEEDDDDVKFFFLNQFKYNTYILVLCKCNLCYY